MEVSVKGRGIMRYVDFILDDYIDSVETYAENLNKELNRGGTLP